MPDPWAHCAPRPSPASRADVCLYLGPNIQPCHKNHARRRNPPISAAYHLDRCPPSCAHRKARCSIWCKAQGLKREWGMGGPTGWAPETSAAPATVSGERAFIRPLSPSWGWEGESPPRPASQETGLAQVKQHAVGCDGKEIKMTTITTSAKATSTLASVLFMAVLGLGLLFVAGHAQSAALHDAAHDVRHATGFPCH